MGQDHQRKEFHQGLLKKQGQDYFETQENPQEGFGVDSKVRMFHASNTICSPVIYTEATHEVLSQECLWNS